ncbi:hypothetical protein EB796_016417 [Bugula neritina]|uniref:Uncharacterized protein n=1 Tax=Bugula neritina TaxID=10212 RepID=A0A7J7JI31_BUGNE|nr:hypothetical protein EB796_016417 [Bugula neritina]
MLTDKVFNRCLTFSGFYEDLVSHYIFYFHFHHWWGSFNKRLLCSLRSKGPGIQQLDDLRLHRSLYLIDLGGNIYITYATT